MVHATNVTARSDPDEGPPDPEGVRRALRELVVPMGIALLLAGSVNVVDTLYLSLLGDRALAAFSFLLPVLVGSQQLCIGYGIGVTSVVSRASGARDGDGAARFAAHTGAFAALLAAFLGLALHAGARPLVRALGAAVDEQPLADAFLRCWTPGIPFIVFTSWGTAVLRGFGETRSTALVMLLQALVNLLLAPVLMFGPFGMPPLGMGGAGLSLAAASGCSSVLTGLLLFRRRDSIRFALVASGFGASIRATLAVAMPAVLTYLLAPAVTAFFTIWLARYGSDAVAAFGVAARFESFVMMLPLAIGAGLGPFIGHRWAAGRHAEVRYATTWSSRLAWSWGIGAAVLLAVLAWPLGALLADRAELASAISAALLILPLGFASQGAITIASSVYNNVGRASWTAAFAAIRTIGVALPVGATAQLAFGKYGLYAALPLAAFVTERIATHRLRRDRFRSEALRAAPSRRPPASVTGHFENVRR